MEHECESCGYFMEPEGNWFIAEVDKNLQIVCPECGQKFDIEHDCYEDFCTEVLFPITPSVEKEIYQ